MRLQNFCQNRHSGLPPGRVLRALRGGVLLLCLTIVVGCSRSGSGSDTPSDMSEINADQVLLVGSISRLKAVTASALKEETDNFIPFDRERVLLWLKPLKQQAKEGERLGLLVDWGRVYFFAVPKTSMRLTELERAYYEDEALQYRPLGLPEPMRYLVRVDDRVVYIGHLRLYVNEFDDVVAVEVVDDAKSAKQTIETQFGEGLRFRVSLLTPEEYLR
ncbi:hypothetical protein [Enterovibrio paralichthyis]|uniref:hypothetical protein n=1 Tax=Enterovibrio paralichthyis TaxID=2853805 RepID=UPI002105112D|nr:hypothetical protein [Enterovibrio paralichthyis]